MKRISKQVMAVVMTAVILFLSVGAGHNSKRAEAAAPLDVYYTYEAVANLIEIIVLCASGYNIKDIAEKDSAGNWKLSTTGEQLLEANAKSLSGDGILKDVVEWVKKKNVEIEGLGIEDIERINGVSATYLKQVVGALLSEKFIAIGDALHGTFAREYASTTDVDFGGMAIACHYVYNDMSGKSPLLISETRFSRGRVGAFLRQVNAYPETGQYYIIKGHMALKETYGKGYPDYNVDYVFGMTYVSYPGEYIRLDGAKENVSLYLNLPIFKNDTDLDNWVDGRGTLNEYEYSLPDGSIYSPESTRPVYYPMLYPDVLTFPEGLTDPNAIIDTIAKRGIDTVVGLPIPIPDVIDPSIPGEIDLPGEIDVPGEDTATGWLGGLLEWLQRIIDAIRAIPGAIWNFFSSMIGNISDLLQRIWELIGTIIDLLGNFVTELVNGIMDMLNLLFVPRDGYFTDRFEELKNKFSNRFGFGVYTEMIKALGSYVSGNLNFGGYIDISMWTEKGRLGTIQNFLRGFFYPLMLIGFVKFLTWLIRGSTNLSSESPKGGGKKGG